MKVLTDFFYKKMNAERKKAFESGEYKYPDEAQPIEVDENAKLNFVVWGDCQVSNYMFARECSFQTAIDDIANIKGKLDALVICGDIAENGLESEYRVTADMINSVSDKYEHFIGMPGNHDVRFRRYKTQLRRFSSFLENVDGSSLPVRNYSYSLKIKGYTFIVMGADRSSFESAYINEEQLAWLECEISKATRDGKPIFVFNHQTLKKTNGLPYTWLGRGKWRGSVGMQSDEIKKIFERYGNVFFITGHLHFGTSKYSFEDYGAYKALAVQTIGAGNHGDCSNDAQGFLISVFDDRVEIKARVFGVGRFVEKDVPCSEVIVPLEKIK